MYEKHGKKRDAWLKMNSSELQRGQKAKRNPDKSIIRSAEDRK